MAVKETFSFGNRIGQTMGLTFMGIGLTNISVGLIRLYRIAFDGISWLDEKNLAFSTIAMIGVVFLGAGIAIAASSYFDY